MRAEGRKVERHVQRQAVVAALAAHAHADARKLGARDVDARRAAAALGAHAGLRGEVDHRTLERGDEVAHPEGGALQVDERIDHQLPGTVVGHLPAAIDLHHRDVTRGRAGACGWR